ncbi:MAG TPA: hypothetical protein VKI44_03870 [Acetobacteraceae bacterium]|nr:hypothetical protein [Acetobacteraceae bacterium]
MPEPIEIAVGTKATIPETRTAIASGRVSFGLAAPSSDRVEPQAAGGGWVVCPWCRSPRWFTSTDVSIPDEGRRTLVICGACGRPFFAG